MANFWSVPRGTNRRTHCTRGTGYPIVVRTRYWYRVPGTRVLGYSTDPDLGQFSQLQSTGVSFCQLTNEECQNIFKRQPTNNRVFCSVNLST
eukprot:3568541-Rhodomonas_salina.1